jgi:hypothetical protein
MEVVETDEEHEARVRAWRTAEALRAAPDLVMHIRAQIVPGGGGASDGMPRATSKEPPAPARLEPMDDADDVYAQLVLWVTYWAEELRLDPPSSTVIAWSNRREVQGFRAMTTPEGARTLTHLQSLWLNLHAEKIAAHDAGVTFQDNIVDVLSGLRGKYPTAPRPPRKVFPRQCPVCDEFAVGAEWFSEDTRDVEVKCAECGYEVPAKSYARILDWLE